MRDKGFGDTFDRFTKTTGIKWLIITVTGWFGVNCGCEYRRKLFNKWFPYKQKKKMNKKITLEEILDPVNPKIFFTKYWGKKHLAIRRNKFKNLFSWKDFSNYLNQYPYVKSLQIIDWNDGGGYDKKERLIGRWCLDKVRNGKSKNPMLSKQEVYNLWSKDKKSFVIPLAEYQKKEFVDICFELEKYFQSGTVNVYASPCKGSKSFPAHADQTENFLFHTEGKTKWKIYKEFSPDKPKKVIDEFILEAGDLLYIPQFQYHEVETVGPRMLLSVHFPNKPSQTLDNFKVTKIDQSTRNKWYNWNPDSDVKKDLYQHDISRGYRMNSPSWKKKYLDKLHK